MLLDIVTPTKRMHYVMSGETHELPDDVLHIVVPGVDGEFQVLNQHAGFFSLLKTGVVRFQVGVNSIEMMVSGGFCEVNHDRVTILTEQAAYASEVEKEEEEKALDRALKALAALGAVSVDSSEFIRHQTAAAQAKTKLDLIKK